MRTFVFTALAVLGWTACDVAPTDSETDPETTKVVISLSAVPTDVQCLRITAAGPSRITLREIEVIGGEAYTEVLTGLPTGSVLFTGEAFGADCDSVTKSTTAAWVSDPVAVSITLGRQASVALTMHRNGRAKVAVDFVDEVDAGGGRPDAGAGSEDAGM